MTDIVEFNVDNEVCVYTITNRPKALARMLRSISLGTYIPKYICIVTNDRDTVDNFDVGYASQLLRQHDVRIDYIQEEKTGLSAMKNVALDYVYAMGAEIAISMDDDFVVEPYCIERLVVALQDRPELFAVGPVKREWGDWAVPYQKDSEIMREEMVYFEPDRTWIWGGFRQGVRYPEYMGIISAQHLAGMFAHRYIHEHRYDEFYDRPPYFFHESDYVFGRNVGVVTNAVYHHWPPAAGNLRDLHNGSVDNMHDRNIEISARYFAQKHGLGEVKEFTWHGFVKEKVAV